MAQELSEKNGFEHQLPAGSHEIRETAQLSSRVLGGRAGL